MKIAVIVENSSWYGRQIIDGVAAYARSEQDWSLVWCNPRNRSVEEIVEGCRGAIVRIVSDGMAQRLCRSGLPVVDVFCTRERDEFCGVESDNEAIGRMAARYFRSKRYTTLAFAGFKGVRFSQMRHDGFSAATGCEAPVLLVHEAEMINNNKAFFNDEAVDAVDSSGLASWLRTLPRHAAVFAANDLLAAQISRTASELSIRIPEDMVLLGVDNDSQLCAFADTPISSIDPSSFNVGYSAARMLAAILRRKPAAKRHPIHRVRPGELVERASTRWHDVSPEWLADALGFIDASLEHPLSTSDIVAHTGLSHVAIGRMFRKKLGISPQRYIVGRKMDVARRLLDSDRSLRVKEVAARMGFSSPAYFCNVYRQRFGRAPRE